MYENRTYHLGKHSGVSPEIVNIFTSRIPKDYVRITTSGRERHRDGDAFILPILDRIYDLKGTISTDSQEFKNFSYLYQIKKDNDKKILSFERFVLLETLRQIFPKERTSMSEKIVRFPRDVNLLKMDESEVLDLYNWLIC